MMREKPAVALTASHRGEHQHRVGDVRVARQMLALDESVIRFTCAL